MLISLLALTATLTYTDAILNLASLTPTQQADINASFDLFKASNKANGVPSLTSVMLRAYSDGRNIYYLCSESVDSQGTTHKYGCSVSALAGVYTLISSLEISTVAAAPAATNTSTTPTTT